MGAFFVRRFMGTFWQYDPLGYFEGIPAHPPAVNKALTQLRLKGYDPSTVLSGKLDIPALHEIDG